MDADVQALQLEEPGGEGALRQQGSVGLSMHTGSRSWKGFRASYLTFLSVKLENPVLISELLGLVILRYVLVGTWCRHL